MKNILKTGIITTLSVIFFGITNKANADLIRECNNFLDAQNYQKALQIGLEAVRTEPNNVGSYVCVVESYYRLGHYRQAMKYLKIAEKYAVSKIALAIVYNLEGVVYDSIGDLNNALLYDNRALSLDIELGDRNEESLDLEHIANVYQDMGKLNKALKFFKKSLALSDEKEKGGIYSNISTIYYNKGDYKKAIEYERKAIEIDQGFGNYYSLAGDYLNLGSIYTTIKDFSKAKYYLEQGLSMEKEIGDLDWLGTAYRYLGNLYLAEGEKTSAKENWKKALKYFSLAGDKTGALAIAKELNQANAGLLRECANFLDAQNYQRALQIGLEAVRAEPNNVGSYVCVGGSYSVLGHYNQAIKYLKIAEKYAVSKIALALVYHLEGGVYYKIKDLNNALLYDNRSLSLDIELGDRNEESSELNDIADVYQDMGKLNKALKFYNKSLALSDEKRKGTIYGNIALIYYDKGSYRKAIEYERKAIEIDQRFGNYYSLAASYLNLGSIYTTIKDFSKAKYYLEQGLSMEKKIGNLDWLGTAYGYLGQLYLEEGEKTLAKKSWKEALKYYSLAGNKPEVFVTEFKLHMYKLQHLAK